ncbi:MAG TPA: sensor histidine kinase [Candidatus Kapabacteria bacterium]|jgi:signal transduction histidine kinase
MNSAAPVHSTSVGGTNPVFVHRARRVGRIAVFIGSVVFVIVPIRWIFKVPLLGEQIPAFTPAHSMGLVFTLSIVLSILCLYSRISFAIPTVLSAIVVLCSVLVFAAYLLPGPSFSDSVVLLFDPIEHTSRISPNGALCLLSASASVFLLSTFRERAIYVAQSFALVCATVSALAMIGHAYSLQPLYGISDYSQMSVPGAICNFLFSLGVMCVMPDRGLTRILVTNGPAGVMSRRMFTAAALVPPVLGFLALIPSAQWQWYDLPFAVVLVVMATILLFAIVVGVTSHRVERADIFRQQAEEQVRLSRERLRELSAHIQVMQEEERIRIAREVHDELGQSLTALKMDLSMLRKTVPERVDIERRIHSMNDVLNGTIRSVQRISSELRPSVLDDLGLAAAIEWQAREFEKRSGLCCSILLPTTDMSINASQATALFRVFQEALTNVARHANARTVDVELLELYGEDVSAVRLRVHDDGVGFDEAQMTSGHSLGLMGMRERAALAGGTFEMESAPGAGMTVIVTMPQIA